MKPKLLYYEILGYRQQTKDVMHKWFDVISLPDPRFDTTEILSKVEIILAPLGFKCDEGKIALCTNLRVIGSNTTGEPHIDRRYAESKGINVCTLADDHEFLEQITSTAEHTIGLILSLTRNVPWAFQSVLSGTWNRRLFGGKKMLSRQTIGIIGLGRLGSLVARYGASFGMKVLFYDPYAKINRIEENWDRCQKIEELVEASDIITLHIPANEQTRGLISEPVISRFKHGAILINTARAECVDETALLQALRSGTIAGAAVDVLKGEFDPCFEPQSHPLVDYAKQNKNLIITPHIGGSTEDAWGLTEIRTLEKIHNAIRR